MREKICFYAIATELGGAEKSLFELVRNFKNDPSSRWEPIVLLPKNHGPLLELLKTNQISYRVIEIPTAFLKMTRSRFFYSAIRFTQSVVSLIYYFRSVGLFINEEKIKLIHTTGLKCHILSVYFSIRHRIPVIWHLRDLFDSGPSYFILRILAKVAHPVFIANSHLTARPFASKGYVVNVIYNGFDPKEFYPKRHHDFQKHFEVDESVPVIGIVGIFARWKGQFEFLKAAQKLMDMGVNARYVLVGKNIYDTDGEKGIEGLLEDEAKKLKISDRVWFQGFKSDVAYVMNGIDVLVHASIKPEPFGRVIIEAMACETCVIASNLGAVREFTDNENEVLWVDTTDPLAIALALKRLMNEPNLKRKLITNARELFLNRFTNERYYQQVKEVLLESTR